MDAKSFITEALKVLNDDLVREFDLINHKNELLKSIGDSSVSEVCRDSFVLMTLYFLSINYVVFDERH